MASTSTQTVRVPERQPVETTAQPRPVPRPVTKPYTIKIQSWIPA